MKSILLMWAMLILGIFIGNVITSRAHSMPSIIEGREKLLEEYEINTPLRLAHFLAQVAHESGGFKYFTENISESDATANYGAGTPTGKILGNREAGDGYKYRGRGLIHLTGRWNYTLYGHLAKLDLINNPDLAAEPDNAWHIAVLFWNEKKLNLLADRDDIKGITKKIQGGLNGLEDRMKWLAEFKYLGNLRYLL